MPHAVVVGAGTMGSGIAMVFAAEGWRVSVVDPANEARETLLERMTASMGRLGLSFSPAQVITAERLEDVVWSDVAAIMESAAEDLRLKQELFRTIDSLAPAAIPVSTNSTGFTIDEIAEGLNSAERMLGVHFLMPAQFVPLVEIIPGKRTDPKIVDSTTKSHAAARKATRDYQRASDRFPC